MEKINNSISIVALGNFNPAILTPKFFKEYCDFSCDLKDIKSRTTPVASSLVYKNIELSVELGRYQIVERNIRNETKANLLKYFLSYFKILRYTPMFKVGVNFNSKIIGVNQNILKFLNETEKLRKVLNGEYLIYTKKVKISKSDFREILWDLNYDSKEGFQVTISLKLNNSDLDINHNFEFSNIENYRIIYKINRKYQSLARKNRNFINHLMKGV